MHFFGAYFRDLNGNKIAVFHREDVESFTSYLSDVSRSLLLCGQGDHKLGAFADGGKTL